MPYYSNPHLHVKIWLTNNRDVFMNFENQKRLIEMREKNPKDTIHLVYDSSLLSPKALQEMKDFCKENNIIGVDIEDHKEKLITDNEKKLFAHYKDEVMHLSDGGNLAVASDILRWLRPVYTLGSYSDFDFPIDTSAFPERVTVDSPLLLNVGTLKIGKQQLIFTNNDYISVVDADAAQEQIERIQKGIISKLTKYETDFINSVEEKIGKNSLLGRTIIYHMKNRAEAFYIEQSTSLPMTGSSRKLRAYINNAMSNEESYLNFHRKDDNESRESVIQRLRADYESQLGIVKQFFFNSEYKEIKKLLTQIDSKFLEYAMKKERSLYLKSIVVCTTGPIEIARSLFGTYVMSSSEIKKQVRPCALSHYGLHKAFKSQNMIALNESPVGMLRYLGAGVGTLNDSSWLEEGRLLQQMRYQILLDKRESLRAELPSLLSDSKKNIEHQIKQLQKESSGFFGFFRRSRKAAKIDALQKILSCFNEDAQSFDINQFRAVLADSTFNRKKVFSGVFSKRTATLINHLEQLSHDAVVYRLAKDKKLAFVVTAPKETPLAKLSAEPNGAHTSEKKAPATLPAQAPVKEKDKSSGRRTSFSFFPPDAPTADDGAPVRLTRSASF